MADTPFPFPRELRESTVLLGDGTAGPFGPSPYKIFDTADVTVWRRDLGEANYADVTGLVAIAKTSGLPFDTFSVTFPAAVPATTQWYHQARRTAERSVAVTRAGTINGVELEKELSKQASAQSELRRDVDRVPRVAPGQTVPNLAPLAEGHGYKADAAGNLVDAGFAVAATNRGVPGQIPEVQPDGTIKFTSSPITGGGDMLADAYDPEKTGSPVAFADGVSRPYFSRAAAQAATHAALALILMLSTPSGHTLRYRQDNEGTALTTADGRKWSPDGDVYPDHFSENTAPGTTDMTMATAAAMAYAETVKLLPGQEYVFDGLVTKPGRTLVAVKNKLTLKAGATGPLITIDGGNFKLDGQDSAIDISATPDGTAGQPAINNASGTCENITVRGFAFEGQKYRPYIALAATVACDNLVIENNAFVGRYDAGATDAAFDGGGIRLLYTQLGNRNVKIRNNFFSRITANSIQMRTAVSGGDFSTNGAYVGVDISENLCFDPAYNLTTGHTWFETANIDALTCDRNIMLGGGRGLSCGGNRNASYSGNVLFGLYSYGCEMSYSETISFSGNVVKNCAYFIADNGSSGYTQTKNVSVTGNLVVGGNAGLAGWNTGDARSTIRLNNNDEGYDGWTIAGNTFVDITNVAYVIDIRGSALTTRISVNNNVYRQTIETACPQFVNFRYGKVIRCRGNEITRTVDITDATGSIVYVAIGITVGASMDDVSIRDNVLIFAGTDARTVTHDVIGIGSNSSSGALTALAVNDNTVRGGYSRPLKLVVNSGDTQCLGNDTRLCTGTNQIDASVVYRNNLRQCSGSAAPTTQAWLRGDIVWNTGATASGNAGWICVSSGSPGTWKNFGTIAA